MHTLRLKLEVDKNTAYIMEKRFRILAHISNQIRKHVNYSAPKGSGAC